MNNIIRLSQNSTENIKHIGSLTDTHRIFMVQKKWNDGAAVIIVSGYSFFNVKISCLFHLLGLEPVQLFLVWLVCEGRNKEMK